MRPETDDYVSRQLYLPNTAILVTRFMTEEGVGELIDFMPVAEGEATDRHRLVRMLRVVRGTMSFVAEVKPKFDYGRASHRIVPADGDGCEVRLRRPDAHPASRRRPGAPRHRARRPHRARPATASA